MMRTKRTDMMQGRIFAEDAEYVRIPARYVKCLEKSGGMIYTENMEYNKSCETEDGKV